MLRPLMHVVAMAQFSFGVYYDLLYVHLPEVMGSDEFRNFGGFGGKSKYFSLWNLALQALFFGICVLNDFFGSNEINPRTRPTIRKVKDYLFVSIAFPTTMVIGLSFWTLMLIDRELVFPKFLDLYVPMWLNHLIHTNTMIFPIIEGLTSFRTYPRRADGLKGLFTYVAVYVVWMLFIYHKTGEWVYPIFKTLDWGQRIVHWAGLFTASTLLYFVGEFANNTVWAKEVKELESRKKKSNKKSN